MMLIICHYNACVLYLTPTMAAEDGVRPDWPNGTARADNAYGPKETLDMSWFYVSDLQSMEKTQQYFCQGSKFDAKSQRVQFPNFR